MGRPARATPVQVYVGMDSGPDARTRVALAMAELDRTDAWYGHCSCSSRPPEPAT